MASDCKPCSDLKVYASPPHYLKQVLLFRGQIASLSLPSYIPSKVRAITLDFNCCMGTFSPPPPCNYSLFMQFHKLQLQTIYPRVLHSNNRIPLICRPSFDCCVLPRSKLGIDASMHNGASALMMHIFPHFSVVSSAVDTRVPVRCAAPLRSQYGRTA